MTQRQRLEAASRAAPLRFLPRFLFDARHPKGSYILKLWLLAFIPSLVLAALVNLAVPDAAQPDIPVGGWLPFVLVAIVTPLVETLIMAAILLGLNRLFGPGPAIILSAVLWGIAHSLAAPIWGLVVWWPFLLFSIAYLTWRQKSTVAAILIVSAAHALQNGVAGFALLLG